MKLEVKFQAYAIYTHAYESGVECRIGPLCDTPEEAIGHVKRRLPQEYKQHQESVRDGEEFTDLDNVIIRAHVEGFPREDLPWEDWIGAG